MAFRVRIFSAEDVPPAHLQAAAVRFSAALEDALGDSTLVWPCYAAYQKLSQQYADHARPWPVAEAEQMLIEQWEAAELSAIQAVFGTQRYLGDADYEILP